MDLTQDEMTKLKKLLKSIKSIESSNNIDTITFNKTVVLESEDNFITIANGFAITQAKQVHLNPFETKKDITDSLLTLESLEFKKKIVESIVSKLNIIASIDEIEGIVSGRIDINDLIDIESLKQSQLS